MALYSVFSRGYRSNCSIRCVEILNIGNGCCWQADRGCCPKNYKQDDGSDVSHGDFELLLNCPESDQKIGTSEKRIPYPSFGRTMISAKSGDICGVRGRKKPFTAFDSKSFEPLYFCP